MVLFLYFEHPVTDRRHLADGTKAFAPLRTLCGAKVAELVPGDESPSGVAASCRRCRAKAGLPDLGEEA